MQRLVPLELGEHGRGFSVVADEVRSLASRTQQSTEEIITIIEQLHTASHSAVNVMALSTSHAEHSVESVSNTGNSLLLIAKMVDEINSMNIEIAASTNEQNQ